MGEILLEDIKKWDENYGKSQAFLRECPKEVQVFLEPIINLAGDYICDICYEKGLDPLKIKLYTEG